MKAFIFIVLGIVVMSCRVSKTNLKFANNPVVAHRGAWKAKGLPENSIASLQEAIALGCAGSEFDVRMTSDGVLVINHDPHFHEMDIENSTFEELNTFKLSNGEPLPTLSAYLKAGMKNNSGTRLVLEIKPSVISKERGRQIAEKVYQMVEESGAATWVSYISFDFDMLLKLKELNGEVITQYLENNKSPEEVSAQQIDGIDYYFKTFRNHPEWIESAKRNHLILNAWTVNEAEDISWLLGNNFDFITTNEPELALKLFQER